MSNAPAASRASGLFNAFSSTLVAFEHPCSQSILARSVKPAGRAFEQETGLVFQTAATRLGANWNSTIGPAEQGAPAACARRARSIGRRRQAHLTADRVK